MRRFSYTWKSSDGERHVDEMAARRKDDVFAALRDRGIRPIKVEPLPRSFWWWMVRITITLSVLAAVFVANRIHTAESREQIDELRIASEDIIEQLNDQLAHLHLDDPTVSPPFAQRLDMAQRTVDVARSRLRLAYRDFGGKAISARERLYGHFMSVLDEKEESIEALIENLDE